jgi:excinuclease UvrABC ATPase subunit
VQLLAPIVVNRKGEHKDLLVDAQTPRLQRALASTARCARWKRSSITLDKKSKHDIELVIDRLVLKPDLKAAAHRLGREGAERRQRRAGRHRRAAPHQAAPTAP